ncbi:alpha/beta fold hydrolase [Litchfieldia alkalitelluris]|uniref:alpha/beta fold hydrolase n=1 Tax=Litchfieldia alkalitelluris TaxID=304268 RepID=UPI000998CC36|nr:alpha/beta hydrolase [Litchfieldia alkalitelluris]
MGVLPKKVDFIIPADTGINKIEKLLIGGVEQSILIQGENKNHPVLLFLHGGPSMPLPGLSCRGRDYVLATNTKELVKHFVVVFWDQRGTGKSYHSSIPRETMRLTQFISDAVELVDYLRAGFNTEKLFLAGHSWGSVLGLHLVKDYPEKFFSYVGLSQIVSWVENDRLSLQWVKEEAKRRGNKKAMQELDAVGQPPFLESFEQWGVLRRWQARFNSMFFSDEQTKSPGMGRLAKIMLQSPDYSLKDIYHSLYKGFKLVYHMPFIDDLSNFNFRESGLKLTVPITFIHGRHDVHVVGSQVEDYYNRLEAPYGKQLIWVENSSHAFHPDDASVIEKVLIEEKNRGGACHRPKFVESNNTDIL